jgi:hypothetical protein
MIGKPVGELATVVRSPTVKRRHIMKAKEKILLTMTVATILRGIVTLGFFTSAPKQVD